MYQSLEVIREVVVCSRFNRIQVELKAEDRPRSLVRIMDRLESGLDEAKSEKQTAIEEGRRKV